MEQMEYEPELKRSCVLGDDEAMRCHKDAAASSGKECEEQQQKDEEQLKRLVASSKEMKKIGLL